MNAWAFCPDIENNNRAKHDAFLILELNPKKINKTEFLSKYSMGVLQHKRLTVLASDDAIEVSW